MRAARGFVGAGACAAVEDRDGEGDAATGRRRALAVIGGGGCENWTCRWDGGEEDVETWELADSDSAFVSEYGRGRSSARGTECCGSRGEESRAVRRKKDLEALQERPAQTSRTVKGSVSGLSVFAYLFILPQQCSLWIPRNVTLRNKYFSQLTQALGIRK
jgi:hypothetical protein